MKVLPGSSMQVRTLYLHARYEFTAELTAILTGAQSNITHSLSQEACMLKTNVLKRSRLLYVPENDFKDAAALSSIILAVLLEVSLLSADSGNLSHVGH